MPEQPVQRKLSARSAADIAGYSPCQGDVLQSLLAGADEVIE